MKFKLIGISVCLLSIYLRHTWIINYYNVCTQHSLARLNAKHWIKYIMRVMCTNSLQSWFSLKVIIEIRFVEMCGYDAVLLLWLLFYKKIVGNNIEPTQSNIMFCLGCNSKPSNAIDQHNEHSFSFFVVWKMVWNKNNNNNKKWQQSKLRSTMTWWIVTVEIISVHVTCSYCYVKFLTFVIFCWKIDFKVIFFWDHREKYIHTFNC